VWLGLSLLFVLGGCVDSGAVDEGGATAAARDVAATGDAPSGGAEEGTTTPLQGAVSEARPRVLFLGTSLTAGYSLSLDAAYPARLAELLEERGTPIEVVNAGVSGDTSAGGLARLDWLLREPPDLVFVELGANDGLRGLPVEATEENLLKVIHRAQAVGAGTIVAGMLMPPNYGEEYTERFAAIFPRVAKNTQSPLVPFLLDRVAADPSLNLSDGIHPNPEGHERVAETVLPFFVEWLDRVKSDQPSASSTP